MAEWVAQQVRANGIKLNTCRLGQGPLAVVLMHGITDNGLCWRRTAEALAADYTVIAYDARGHGLSDKPEAGYSRFDHAADGAALIKALGLKRPVLLGHSMGAANAATLAAQYPDLVRAVILEDPPWRANWDRPVEVIQAEWAQLIQERQAHTLDALIAQQRSAAPHWPEQMVIDWAEAKLQTSPHAAGFATADMAPWQQMAAQLVCPTLLLHADNEAGAIVTPATAAEFETLVPQARAVYVPGAGHSIRRDQYEAYLAAVTAFLASLTTG